MPVVVYALGVFHGLILGFLVGAWLVKKGVLK